MHRSATLFDASTQNLTRQFATCSFPSRVGDFYQHRRERERGDFSKRCSKKESSSENRTPSVKTNPRTGGMSSLFYIRTGFAHSLRSPPHRLVSLVSPPLRRLLIFALLCNTSVTPTQSKKAIQIKTDFCGVQQYVSPIRSFRR